MPWYKGVEFGMSPLAEQIRKKKYRYDINKIWDDEMRCVYDDVMWDMGWLQLVGSIKLQVAFAKESHKRDNIVQKRPIIFYFDVWCCRWCPSALCFLILDPLDFPDGSLMSWVPRLQVTSPRPSQVMPLWLSLVVGATAVLNQKKSLRWSKIIFTRWTNKNNLSLCERFKHLLYWMFFANEITLEWRRAHIALTLPFRTPFKSNLISKILLLLNECFCVKKQIAHALMLPLSTLIQKTGPSAKWSYTIVPFLHHSAPICDMRCNACVAFCKIHTS